MHLEKLRQTWEDHARAVYAFLLKLTRREADARDFLQDVFHRLARQPELLDGLNGEARPYLLRFARNVVIDSARRNQVRDRILGVIELERRGDMAAAADPDAQLLRAALARGLAALPAGQREVVHARLWQGRTFDDIARTAGLSINTVASRYRYGLDKLRVQLRDLYEDLAPQASPNSKLPMKHDTENPHSLTPEEPLIQPLEARRVPSATAAGALPVLPADDANDAPDFAEDEVFFDDTALDDEEIIALDDEDLAFITLPIDFDEMAEGIDWSVGEDGEPFDPRILWQTMTVDPATGEGGVVDPMVVRGEDGEPVDGEVEVMAEDDPRIYYSAVGGDTGGEAGTPAPVAAPVVALGEEPAPVEITRPASAPVEVATPVPVAAPAPEITVPETAPLASAPAPIEHTVAALETPEHTELAATLDQDVQLEVPTAPVAAIDHWAPLESATEPPSLALDTEPLLAGAAPVIELDAALHTDHDGLAADAGAVSQSPTLRQGAMAAALAGSVVLSRDAQARPKNSTH